MEYEFCKPDTPEDYEGFYRLMDAAFGDEDVRGITRRFAENHPDMNDENFFMVKFGDEVAAGLLLLPQTWIIDGVELKVAEMGCVGTHPDHRRKQLQWILNDKFDEYARENGFDLCVLAGIPYFYRQFGYQYAVELDYSTEIEVNQIPDAPSSFERRPTGKSDIEKIDEILRGLQENYYTKSVRTHGTWEMQLETGTYGGEPYDEVILTKGEEVAAYYRYVIDEKNKTLKIRELGYNGLTTAEEVAAHLKLHSEEQGLTKVKTALAHVDPISKHLKKLGAKMNKPYAWQVKPLDLFGLMEKMKPAFERRIAGSEHRGLKKDLLFNFWKFAVKMEIKDGVIQKMEKRYGEKGRSLGFNPYAFIQLIMGYKNREELMGAYPDFYVKDGLDDLIDVMFPKKQGYIHYTY